MTSFDTWCQRNHWLCGHGTAVHPEVLYHITLIPKSGIIIPYFRHYFSVAQTFDFSQHVDSIKCSGLNITPHRQFLTQLDSGPITWLAHYRVDWNCDCEQTDTQMQVSFNWRSSDTSWYWVIFLFIKKKHLVKNFKKSSCFHVFCCFHPVSWFSQVASGVFNFSTFSLWTGGPLSLLAF